MVCFRSPRRSASGLLRSRRLRKFQKIASSANESLRRLESTLPDIFPGNDFTTRSNAGRNIALLEVISFRLSFKIAESFPRLEVLWNDRIPSQDLVQNRAKGKNIRR